MTWYFINASFKLTCPFKESIVRCNMMVHDNVFNGITPNLNRKHIHRLNQTGKFDYFLMFRNPECLLRKSFKTKGVCIGKSKAAIKFVIECYA